MIRLLPEEQKVWTQYVRSITGIVIEESMGYLIENRLGGLAEKNGCATFSELYFKARSDPTQKIQRAVIDLITTGETLFFRDTSPFELLQFKLLPELIDRKRKTAGPSGRIPIRIWSAACSTGQEVYSIAMTVKETITHLQDYDVLILGTDLSDQAVAKASRGAYGRIEVERGLPKDRMAKYFSLSGDLWQVNPEIRGMVTFQKVNLLEDFARLGRFDIVFCRNVAIYFSEADKKSLFNRIGKALDPDGCLIIGATESITAICQEYESKRYLRSVFYQLRQGR